MSAEELLLHLEAALKELDQVKQGLAQEQPTDCKPYLSTNYYHLPRRLTLEQIKRELVQLSLQAHQGSRTAAAAALGLPRRTLYSWLPSQGPGGSEPQEE